MNGSQVVNNAERGVTVTLRLLPDPK